MHHFWLSRRRSWAALLSVWFALTGFSTTAQSRSTQPASSLSSTPSVATALTARGELRPGTTGSFNTTGYQLVTDPLTGAPTFRPAGVGDANWQDGFALPGTNGTVYATALDGAGNLYVGGAFTQVGGLPISYLARWDGHTWSDLGANLNGDVRALTLVGADLYVGGSFTTAGGVSANRIAKWNGTTWSTLGSGFNSAVITLLVRGTTLYAGGSFTQADGAPAQCVARWTGAGWQQLGGGLNSPCQTMATDGTALYVGGGFSFAGNVRAGGVAKWDDISGWSALGTGLSSICYALVMGTDGLYAGGYFTTAGSNPASHVARWDGTSWHALGTGPTDGVDGEVYALAVSGPDLYVGGDFTQAGGSPAANVARWNGTTWQPLAAGTDNTVRSLTATGTDVYAGGIFLLAGDLQANHIAHWSATSWHSLGQGLNGSVYAVATTGTDVYVAGAFTRVGGVAANHIARWDGTAWHSLGAGLSHDVYALALRGPDLYAGGAFTAADGAPASRVAKWDGATWSALGAGVNGAVNALVMIGPDLYVGGNFNQAGGQPIGYLAKWDGTTWSALGTAAGFNNVVQALATDGATLYAGGLFTTIGATTVNRVAQWNGTAWSALGAGTNGAISALAVTGTSVYAGGAFTQAGGQPISYLAQWDGTAWRPLGAGVDGPVRSLRTLGADLFAGGVFAQAGGVPANNLARWDGTTWQPLGTGLNGEVRALAVMTDSTDSRVVAGGTFTAVGDGSKATSCFGIYHLPFTPTPPALVVRTPQTVPAGHYSSLTVTGTGVATLGGPVQVDGAVIVQTGGVLADNCQPLTGSATFTLAASATLRICNAAGLSVSGATGAVQVSGARTYSAHADYEYLGGAQITGNGLPARVRSLTKSGSGTLMLTQPTAVRASLTVAGSGDIDLNGQVLTLRADADTTAQLVNLGTGRVLGATATVQRFIPTTFNAGLGYRHLSAPVAGATVADLTTAGFTPVVNPAYNNLPYVAPPASSFPTVFAYDETHGSTTAAYAGFNTGWVSPTALASPLTVGRGYNTYLKGGLTPDFVGTLTQDNVTLSLTRTGTPAANPSNSKAGWHLVGNPFASRFDWDLVSKPAALANTMSVYRSTGPNAGAYLVRTNGVGGMPDGIVAMGQAFFVRLAGAGPVNLTLPSSARVYTGPAVALQRAAAPDTRPLVQLTVQSATNASVSDAAYVYFEAGATAGFDAQFDGERPGLNVGVPTLSALTSTGEAVAVNGLPESALTSGTSVELALTLPAAGAYTFTAAELRNLAGTSVALLDRASGTRYDLTRVPAVQFTAAAAGSLTGRFALIFGQRVTGTSEALHTTALTVWPNPSREAAPVRVSGTAAHARLTLHDATGRLVATTQADATGTATLPTAGLVPGVYVVRTGAQTSRLIVR